MKTAIVYDRVNKWGGAEQVLLALHEMFPDAPLYTSVYNKETAEWAKVFPEVYTSFLQKMPFAKKNHEYFAPLMPLAFESFNFDDFDLVISVTSEAANGIITKPKTKHICYCLTPTRYLWSGYDQYFKKLPLKRVARPLVNYLRHWDRISGQRPDYMIAISTAVKGRIKKYYDRESEIIFPPVDVNKFQTSNVKSQNKSKIEKQKTKRNFSPDNNQDQNYEAGEYYLIVSRLVSYKKVDMAIRAFNELGQKLIVVGEGREEKFLRSIAKENIEFEGFVSDEELVRLYKNAKAFIYPQEEDFGITAVEAQAAGVPVIAYRSGGATDTIIENKTGMFFDEQTIESLVDGIESFQNIDFDKDEIMENAKKFSKEKFKKEFLSYVKQI